MSSRDTVGYHNYQDLEAAYRQHWFERARARAKSCHGLDVYPLMWNSITANNNISEEIIRSNTKCPWNHHGAIFNNNLSWTWFREQIRKPSFGKMPLRGTAAYELHDIDSLNRRLWSRPNSWEYLSEHPLLTIEAIEEYPDRAWHLGGLCENGGLHWETVLSLCENRGINRDKALRAMSGNETLPISYIMENPQLRWQWNSVMMRKDITLSQLDTILSGDYVNRYPEDIQEINDDFAEEDASPYTRLDQTHEYWTAASRSPALTWEYIQSHRCFLWNWTYLSAHPCVTPEIVKSDPSPWNWGMLSQNPSTTLELVDSFPSELWSWSCLSMNPNMSWDIIQQNMNRPWEWHWISMNPNIGWDTVAENKSRPWDNENLVKNKMSGYEERWKAKERRRWIAARLIHRFYRDVSSDPIYAWARKRLQAEFQK